MAKKLTDISSVLGSLLRSAEISYSDRAHKVWEVWEQAVGPEVARRSAPLSLRRGRLVVGVTTSAWLQQLSFLREQLRTSVNRALGEELVGEIRLRLTAFEEPRPPRPAPSPPPWLALSLPPRTVEAVNRDLAAIQDPELREAIRRARIRAEQARQFKEGREASPPRQSTARRGRGGTAEE